MSEIEAWASVAAGLLVAGAGAVNLGGLLRAELRRRARVQVERERSARCRARSTELVRIIQNANGTVRLLEQDGDGRRLVEIGIIRGEAA